MLKPSNVTVTVKGMKFNAASAHVGIETVNDNMGLPMMGSLQTIFLFTLDIHDTDAVPFANLQALFELANIVTRDKIVPIKVEFWKDDAQLDPICVYNFTGWVSRFHIDGGGGVNHLLNLRLVPALNQRSYTDIKMGN